MRVLMTCDAHSDAVAQTIMAAGRNRVRVMRMPVGAKWLVATTTMAAMAHRALTPPAGTPVGSASHFLGKRHQRYSQENEPP